MLFLDVPPDLPLPIPDFRTVGDQGVLAPNPEGEYLIESDASPLEFSDR